VNTFERTHHGDPPSKATRLNKLFTCIKAVQPACTGLEAYAQISNALNLLEDQIWGPGYYAMPRTYDGGVVTDRLYPSHPESFETVSGFSGVINMVHTKEFIFISRTGAIEIQRDTGESETEVHFSTRRHAVLFTKNDHQGRGVWHESHRDLPLERTEAGTILMPVKAVVASRGWR
jgi:hypothetical protein